MEYVRLFIKLIPLVMVATQYFKKRFDLDGWQVNAVAFLIALLMCFGYAVVIFIPWYKVILWAIGLFIASCGAFDLLKELLQWIGVGIHKRRRAVVKR